MLPQTNRHGLLYVCIFAQIYHCEWIWMCVWTRIILYMLEYEQCTCWWSDKSVLLEVNSQEDGSMCCVFMGTMIHINNLAALPYSPFILFSSLPFDIPVCFHSQNWAHCVQKATANKTKSLLQKSRKVKRCSNSRPTRFSYYISARSHVLVCLCPQTLTRAHKERLLTKWAGSNIGHNIDHIIYSSLSSYKGIDQIIPYAGLGHSQIAKMGLLHLKRVP